MDLSLPAPALAPLLLGCRLRVGQVTVELTEVEAYAGLDDPASHAFRGPTPRAAVMFGPPGRLYVYRSMGIHSCANIVCGPDGVAAAVLLRAARVVDGTDVARARRGDVAHEALGRGPGNLGRALGLTTEDTGRVIGVDDLDLLHRDVAPPISSGPRVGISRHADVPWRWWISGDPTVSAYRRHAKAVAS